MISTSRVAFWILLGAVFLAAFSAEGVRAEDAPGLDYLPNPFAADRPEWDPFGPGYESTSAAGRAEWDPLSPGRSDVGHLISANPFAPNHNLIYGDEVLSHNQLYLQSGGLLVTSGEVNLATPYSLWLYVANWGPLTLSDRGRRVLSHGFVTPGWYRLDLYAETLEAHSYQFNASGWSNRVDLRVSSGGYPTTYSLVGRVVDPYGNGIPNARVRISGSGGVYSTTTNARGYYGMNLPSGTYAVTAELGGFSFTQATGRVWTGTVSAAGTVVGYPVGQLAPPDIYYGGYGWLEGRVTDRIGAGIPGAKVRIDGIFSIATGDDGDYRVSLSPGWHSVAVDAAGYKFTSASVQIRSGQVAKLDFRGTKVIVLGRHG